MAINKTLKECAEQLSCTIITKGTLFDQSIIKNVLAADLMSDLLVAEKESPLVISSLATIQTLRTTDIIGGLGVILVNGKKADEAMISLARELDLSLLQSQDDTYDLCVKIGEFFNS